MQKIILIIIAAVVVVGGGYLFLSGNNGTDNVSSTGGDTAEQNSFEEGTVENASGTGTFADILALGRNIQCEFSYRDEEFGADFTGMVYMADRGERLRGDFLMVRGDERNETHVIRDGRDGYTWGETPFGTVATKFVVDDEGDAMGKNESDPFESDDEVDYSCHSWRVDNGMFVPPSDIEFQDITAEINQIEAATQDLNAAQCGACDQIPDPSAQAQCRAALGC